MTRVTCNRPSQVPAAVKYILWDTASERIVSVTKNEAGLLPA
jgi:hypothetical protein